MENRYYRKTDIDTKFEEIIMHKNISLKAGRNIYVYYPRINGYILVSAVTNNSECMVTDFSVGDIGENDTIVLSSSPLKDSKLYLTYIRYDY